VARLDCDGRGLFVYRNSKGFRVYDSRCPHEATDIPHLALQGTTLTCPKHQWAFDVKSGECIKTGNTPLRQWECKVVKGRLMAQW
jgi:nitrite reductase/ring-hydroxylating ferredoxin subunit